MLWMDVAGVVMAAALGLTLLYSIAGNTAALYREEGPASPKVRL